MEEASKFARGTEGSSRKDKPRRTADDSRDRGEEAVGAEPTRRSRRIKGDNSDLQSLERDDIAVERPK